MSYAPKPRSRLAGCRACFWCCSDRLYPASMGNVLRRWPLHLRAADDQAVTAKRLAAFLWHNGGIEGAARQRASAVRRASSVSG